GSRRRIRSPLRAASTALSGRFMSGSVAWSARVHSRRDRPVSGVADAVLMDFPGDLVRGVLDPIRYGPTYLAVLVTLGVAIMKRPAVPDDGRSVGSRPAKAATMAAMAPWDSTWYLGVHVWGIDTVGHHWNFLTGGLCFGPTGMYYALESWLVSLFVLVFVLV